MGKDMTQGGIIKTLLLFTIPLVLSGVFQQLFNWVDAFIVGNVDGEYALASIGATSAVYNLCITAIVGFTSGISILSAQQQGRKELDKARNTLISFVVILGLFFLLVALLGIFFTTPIIDLLGTPDKLMVVARQYLRIMFIGVPFLAIYNVYAAILRGCGDSRAPFVAIIVSSLINVVLDLLFVAVLKKGAEGAAIATVFAQIVMTVFIVLYTERNYFYLKFRWNRKFFHPTAITQGFGFGLPPTIQASTSSVGNLILQRFMNGFGERAIAAFSTAYRIDSVILLPIVNFGSGIATVVAQNIGAGNPERAKKALKVGLIMMSLISIGLTGLVLATGEYLLTIFGLTSQSVAIGNSFFQVLAIFYIVFGLAMAIRGYLEGRGDMLFSSIAGITALLVRIVVSYGFVDQFDSMIVAYAETFSWVVLLGIYLARYWQTQLKRGLLTND